MTPNEKKTLFFLQTVFACAGCLLMAFGSEWAGLQESEDAAVDDKINGGYGMASFFSIMGGLACWGMALVICVMMTPRGHALVMSLLYKVQNKGRRHCGSDLQVRETCAHFRMRAREMVTS